MKKHKFIKLGGSQSPIAYCHYHKMTLSKTQMDSKGCLEKGCLRLEKYNCEFWDKYNKRKAKSKELRELRKAKLKEENKQFDKNRLIKAIKYCKQCPLCKQDALEYCSQCPYSTTCMAGIIDDIYDYFVKYERELNDN